MKLGNAKGREEELQGGISSTLRTQSRSVSERRGKEEGKEHLR
jgi:hypothetical protein